MSRNSLLKMAPSALPKDPELQAMIDLLDDTDSEVIAEITQALIKRGPAVIPVLESAWVGQLPLVARERIED